MNKLISFIKQFIDEVPWLHDVRKIGRGYYKIDETLQKAWKHISIEPYSAGLFIGELKDGKFKPGFPLLDLLSRQTARKAIVNQKGQTLFLYRNNIFPESIISLKAHDGRVLVENEDGEVLGLGEVKDAKGNKIIKHILDRSDFLKRENKK